METDFRGSRRKSILRRESLQAATTAGVVDVVEEDSRRFFWLLCDVDDVNKSDLFLLSNKDEDLALALLVTRFGRQGSFSTPSLNSYSTQMDPFSPIR